MNSSPTESENTLESLLAEYQTAATWQRLAQLEAALWALRPNDLNTKERHTRQHWLASVLPGNVPHHDIACRQRLLNAPQAIWDRLERKELPVSAAVRIWSTARGHTDPEAEVTRLLEEMDALPNKRVVNGRTVKINHYGAGTTARKSVETEKNAPTSSKKIWFSIRVLMHQMVEHSVQRHNIDTLTQRDLMIWLDRELGTLVSSFNNKLKRHRKVKVRVTRGQMLNACHALSVEPPAMGQMANMIAVKRNYRQLCKQYHPDTSRVDNAPAKLQAVVEAKNIIEQYNDELEKEQSANV
jgi:DnaJ-domain-containing protein 1